MRTRRALLLASVAAVSSAIVASAAWSAGAPVPGAGFVWAQPGASSVGVTCTMPVTFHAASMLPCGGYLWTQPGTSSIDATTTQQV
jgi:hypothetical protein